MTKIDNIKDLYGKLKDKKSFLVKCAEVVGKSPNTLQNHWFSKFFSIPDENKNHDRVIDLLQKTLSNQNDQNYE